MRHLAFGCLVLIGVAVPQFAWADASAAGQSSSSTLAAGISSNQLQALLESLDISLVAKAYAAECKDEGDVCKTDADCCSGFECSGDPQTTCRPEE